MPIQSTSSSSAKSVAKVPFESIWDQVAPLVARAEKPSRYIDCEWGAVRKPADEVDFRFCMVYPDTYELGQANQALRILVNAVNARPGMAAERGFLPAADMCDKLREQGLPLFSIESAAPLNSFDAIGITLPHERRDERARDARPRGDSHPLRGPR